MIILRQKKVIRVTIWAVAIAFMLSIFVFAGSFFLDRRAREDEEKVSSEIDVKRQQEQAEQERIRALEVATYKGGVVTVGEITDLYTERLNPELKRYFQGREGKKRLVQQYAVEQLQLKASERFYPNLTGEVDAAVGNLAQAQQAKGGLENVLAQQGMTMADLRTMLKNQLLMSKRDEFITAGKSVGTREIEAYFELHKDDAFAGQDLPAVREDIRIKLATTVSEDEIGQFYDEHLDRFRKPDEVLPAHILVKPDSDKWKQQAAAEVTAEKVARHYAEICTRADFKTRGRVTIKHILIDPRKESRMAGVEIPENRARAYLTDHQEEFMTRERRKISQVFIDPRSQERLEPLDVTDEMIGAFYEEHKEQYGVAGEGEEEHTVPPLDEVREDVLSDLKLDLAEDSAREIAETVQDKLSDGTLNFAGAVAEYSDGASRDNGGEIGFLAKGLQADQAVLELAGEILSSDSGILLRPVERKVFSMAAGATSEVIESERGFHIIKLEAVEESRPKTFEEARDEVELKLRPAVAWEDAYTTASKIYNQLREGADFADTAVKFSEAPSAMSGGEFGPIYLGKLPPDLSEGERDRLMDEVASASEVYPEIVKAIRDLRPGEMSDIIKSDKGYHIFMLDSIELLSYLPLDLVRSKVKEDLVATMARAKAEALLEDLRAKIVAGEITFEEAAKQHSEGKTAAEGGRIEWISRDENLGDSPEKADAFRNELASFSFRQEQGRFMPVTVLEAAAAERIFQMDVGEVTPVIETRHGLHLISVVDYRKGEPEPLEDVEKEIREALVSVFTDEQLRERYQELKETFKQPEGEGYLSFEEKREEVEKSLRDERRNRLLEAWREEVRHDGDIVIIHENLKHLEDL